MPEKQYVIFKLGNQEYGIDILNVREISVITESTKVPNMDSFIEGVINMRGKIIPVINLKKRFNLDDDGDAKSSRIIISTLENKEIGFLVDEASQVITMKEEDVDSPPEMLVGIDKNYIVGIGRRDEKLVIILDLYAILPNHEKQKILESKFLENEDNEPKLLESNQ